MTTALFIHFKTMANINPWINSRTFVYIPDDFSNFITSEQKVKEI